MELTFRSDHSVYWQRELSPETLVYIHARDIRRERGTLYAEIVIYLNKTRMDGDDFNLRKNEDKKRLVNGAHKKFPPAEAAAYPVDHLKHDLDIFCEELPRFWEEDQFTLDTYAPGDDIPEVAFTMIPYLLEGAITIVYGPQGTGKSYLAKVMGLSVCGATNGFWPVPVPRPVLYVNLERPKRSVERRAKMLMHSLKIAVAPRMDYLHAPGAHLPTVAPRIRAWLVDNPGGTLILDSLSFTGVGPLNEDSTGVKTIGLLRSIGGTWLVLGHTPRQDTTHLIGSTLQDAGADLMVKLSSEKRGNANGLALQVTKANDTGFPPRYYMAFEFSETDALGRSNLLAVRKAEAKEFPELLTDATGRTNMDKLITYLEEVSEATPSEASAVTNVPYSKVATMFSTREEFVFLKRKGKFKVYGLRETASEPPSP